MSSAGKNVRRARNTPLLYAKHFRDARKERQFLSSISFFVTFAMVRTITHSIRAGIGPFRNITPGGRHIHHMTFGILGLLGVGYLWMLEVGTSETSRISSRATSVAYGAGSALTLDEFALWLNLADDYWTTQGRESIDAVFAFGALLSIGVIGQEFLREVATHDPDHLEASDPDQNEASDPDQDKASDPHQDTATDPDQDKASA